MNARAQAEARTSAAFASARGGDTRDLARVVGDVGALVAADVGAACRKGCTWCCYIPAAVTAVEAVGVAAAAARDPSLAAQVALLAPLIAAVGEKARWQRKLPCPLLRDGACAVYADRPLACRAYASRDAGACEHAFRSGDPEEQLDLPLLEGPRAAAAEARAGIRAAAKAAGLEDAYVELTAAVALILADSTAVPRWLAGEKVFALV